MEINRERSKKIKKLLSLSLAIDMMLSLGTVAKANDVPDEIRKQIEFHRKQYELQVKIASLSEDLYNKEYTDFCDEGTITVNGVDYPIKYLHIEYGYIGDTKKVYLKDYHNRNIDIITGETIDINYKRERINSLKHSDVFYDYYCDKTTDKKLAYYINQYEGGINYSIPETYFYNPELNTNKEKVK